MVCSDVHGGDWMAKKIILVSHDGLAKGVLGAVNMICGKTPDMISLGLSPDGSVTELSQQVRNIVIRNSPHQVIIVADLLGGSVCNQCLQDLCDLSNVKIITGMSLPLVLAILSYDGEFSDADIDKVVKEATDATKRVEIIACKDTDEEFF